MHNISMRSEEGLKHLAEAIPMPEREPVNQIEDELKGQYCLKKVEEMVDLAYQIIPNWPAVFRYTRGEKILQILDEMEDRCIAANLKYFKKTTLQDLDILNHKLRVKIRDARKKSKYDKRQERR